MILKKPYAFLLKHFRLVHLLLIIPMIYLINRTRNITSFLSSYVDNNYIFNGNDVLATLASKYISIFIYIAIVIILTFLVLYSLVLQQKEKPTKFYKFMIIYYAVLLVLVTLCFRVFTQIEQDTLNNVVAGLIKDVGWIIYFSEYILVLLMVIRGTGFDIKHFNFKSEWINLEISSEDNEEFEFEFGKDRYKTKRNLRRFFRELRYYYLENKFIFSIIFLIIIVLIGSVIYRERKMFAASYKEGNSIAFGNINLTIRDSFITELSMNGKVINKGKAYVILQIKLHNRYREDKAFNYANLVLKVDDEYYKPNLYYGNFYLDYGVPFNGSPIKGNTENYFIMVYEIDAKLKNKKMNLEFYNRSNRKINISPTVYNNKILYNKVTKGTKFKLKDTPLNETTVSFLEYSLQNRYEYEYDYCYTNDNCTTLKDSVAIDYAKDNNKTLMILDYSLALDDECNYMLADRSYESFFEDFLEIKYKYNNQEYSFKVDIINPDNYQDKLIMKVPKEIADADSLEVVLTVQNRAYTLNLMENI